MPGTRTLAAMTALCALQGAPIDGTWELTRVFRSGAAPAATRAGALDSTVHVRITLESSATARGAAGAAPSSAEHTSGLQSLTHLVCRHLPVKTNHARQARAVGPLVV